MVGGWGEGGRGGGDMTGMGQGRSGGGWVGRGRGGAGRGGGDMTGMGQGRSGGVGRGAISPPTHHHHHWCLGMEFGWVIGDDFGCQDDHSSRVFLLGSFHTGLMG